jgi:hypothetical protein
MAKHGVGGTKFKGRAGGSSGTIDVPPHVLARWAKEPPPAVLSLKPKYPPGDPRIAKEAEEERKARFEASKERVLEEHSGTFEKLASHEAAEKRDPLVVEAPDLISDLAAAPEKIARNAKRLAANVRRAS